MLNKTALNALTKSYASYAVERRALFAASDELLAKAKQAIFSLHRDDVKAAEDLIRTCAQGLKSFEAKFKKHPAMRFEGPYRAALEEYAEAKQFLAFMKKEPLGQDRDLSLDAESMFGGLSDCVGEMARKTVQWASIGEYHKIPYAQETAREIIDLMLSMNLTGHLRTKLDQAKQGLRRIEDVAYDVSIRQLSEK